MKAEAIASALQMAAKFRSREKCGLRAEGHHWEAVLISTGFAVDVAEA